MCRMNDVTIIIATCGRKEQLASVLDRLELGRRRHELPVELLVVDNHPNATARSVVEAWVGKNLPVRYLVSRPRNKSAALNAGIAAAATDWLAFTDDDTEPDVDWLREGLACLARTGWRVMGGRVVAGPDPANLPRWLKPGRSGRVPGIGVHVRYEPLPATGVVPENGTAPFGANLFVHRDVFRAYGGYDEALWAACERMWPLGCEDSEFGHRLKLRGEPIGYCHEARVVHPVNADRASLRMHLWRAYCDGWRQPLVFSEEHRPWIEPFRIRLIAQRLAGMCGDWWRGDRAGAADHLVEAARVAGSVTGRWSTAYRYRQGRKM